MYEKVSGHNYSYVRINPNCRTTLMILLQQNTFSFQQSIMASTQYGFPSDLELCAEDLAGQPDTIFRPVQACGNERIELRQCQMSTYDYVTDSEHFAYQAFLSCECGLNLTMTMADESLHHILQQRTVDHWTIWKSVLRNSVLEKLIWLKKIMYRE